MVLGDRGSPKLRSDPPARDGFMEECAMAVGNSRGLVIQSISSFVQNAINFGL